MTKTIKPDSYLINFINYCKKKYKDNLFAIVIYGSYVWGYFDKDKSDYDIFVIFKYKVPDSTKEIKRKFKKVSLQYFDTVNGIMEKVKEGHWSIYITLLKSAKVLYNTNKYGEFLNKIKKIKFTHDNLEYLNKKTKFEIKILNERNGFHAAKWALSGIRIRLQLANYLKTKKLIWNLEDCLIINKNILSSKEKQFILSLNKKVNNRSEDFTKKDKEQTKIILFKINDHIMTTHKNSRFYKKAL